MSKPRRILPGSVYLISRRCSERRFFLRPDDETNRGVLFCLLVAALRFDIGIISALAHINHWQGTVLDFFGRLPEFLHHFHAMLAKHQNTLRGRSENFWASQQTSVVELLDPEDIVEKTAYVLANPVKDQLVELAHEWRGISTLDALRTGNPLTATQPKHFFRRGPNGAKTLTMELTLPPGFSSREEFCGRVDARIAEIEDEARTVRRQNGTRVMGMTRVLRQHWNDAPREPKSKPGISPTLAARDRSTRIEALRENKAWLEAYGLARRQHAAGDREAVFPAGTYWLARHSAVRVASLERDERRLAA